MSRLVAAALLAAATTGASAVNQLVNASFENGVVVGFPTGHADTPAPWTSSAPGNAFVHYDTYENSGTTGLPPNFASGIFTGATAPNGIRWAGGWDFEEMAQLLGTPLTPGGTYTMSAQVRPAYTHMGSFEFWIGTAPNTPVSLLTTFSPVNAGSWTFQSSNFVAPANSLANPWFIVKSYGVNAAGLPTTSYIGIDDLFLDRVPAPSTAALGAAGLLALSRRRRA